MPDNRVIAEVLNNAPAIAGGTERVDHKQVVPGRKLEDRDNVLSNAASCGWRAASTKCHRSSTFQSRNPDG
ncbi:hypothetical protein [Congregibacter litoralis]|uniref:hypothetical protein n=1 Tax=Congregibacter litoralis TaxID=393662 RepID=UPI00006AD96D|nr:hypothetical protein [Congregibacter litoralis]